MSLVHVRPESELLKWVENHAGLISGIEALGWDYPLASKVWQLKTERGNYVLKQSVNEGKFSQELRAYQVWLPQVSNTPELLAFEESSLALLCSKVPGILAETSLQEFLQHSTARIWRREEALEMHRQAGAWLKSLHSIPFIDDDPLPLEQAVWARAEDWLKRAQPFVDEADLIWVKAQIKTIMPLLSHQKRVPCHRDYTSRNWLFDTELYVIDFEHARPEYWLFDLEKLWAEVWPQSPDLREAFLLGYGHTWTLEDETIMRAFAALGAVTRIAWSLERGERDYAIVGKKLLKDLINDALARSVGQGGI